MKWFYFLLVSLLSFGCQKKNSSSNSSNSTTTTGGNNNNPPPSLLTGDWILRKTEDWLSPSTQKSYKNYYLPTSCHLNLRADNTAEDGIFVPCSPQATSWSIVSPSIVKITYNYDILLNTNDSLILRGTVGVPLPAGGFRKYFFNKTNNACIKNSVEQALAKNWTYQKYGSPGSYITVTAPNNQFNLTSNSWQGEGWYVNSNCVGLTMPDYTVINSDSLYMSQQLFQIDTLTSSKLVLRYPNSIYYFFTYP